MRFFLLPFLFILHFSGLAQEIKDTITIKEIIITDRVLYNPEQAGMQIRKVDSISMQDKNGQALAELLAENTSIYIKNFAYGSLATASFRGTAASHTRVEWNELPINSPMLGMVDFSLIPVNLIDELTIYEGSSSIIQSSGGLGGAIDLSNKANWNNRLSLEYTQGIGSFHHNREYFKLEIGNSKFQSKTRLYRISALNDFEFINKSIGDIDSVTGEIIHPLDTNSNGSFYSLGLMQEFYSQINNKNILSFQFWGQISQRNLPRISSYEGSENNSINVYDDETHRISFSWKRFLDISSTNYSAAFEYIDILYQLKNELRGLGIVPVTNSGSNALRLVQNLEHKRILSQNSKYSIQIHHQWVNVSTLDTVTQLGYQKEQHNISLRNSIFKTLSKKVHTAFVLNSEIHGRKIEPLIPFLGIDYKPFDSLPLVFKLSASSNYHFPELNDLYWSPGGNPELKPEHGLALEGGIHYVFRTKRFIAKPIISLWRSEIDNWIIWLPSVQGYWQPQNISKVRTSGIDIGLNARFEKNNFVAFANMNYNYGSSVNLGDTTIWGSDAYGKQLSFIPKQSANLFIQTKYKGFFINYIHNHYGRRYISSSNEPGRRFVFYPYFMNNISFGKKLQYKNIQAFAEIKINNIFNETYHSMLLQPMPGRNFFFILRLKYTVPCKN